MSEQNLTKKEIYDLNKEGAVKDRERSQNTRKFKRFLMWGGIFLGLVVIVWGLVKFSGGSTPDVPDVSISDGIVAGDWVKGNKESKVALIEYGDFQCPACGAYHPLVNKLLEEVGDSFQFAYRHFPLQQHPHAKPAAYAAEAAGKQGKFWEMYDMIFERQKDWSNKKDVEEVFLQYATELGLNIDQYKKDRNAKEVREKVENDTDSGTLNKVNSTPTFFLNGKRVQPQSYEEFKSFIIKANSI
ncbi:MAG: thioredoxin domain-containing protein [Patescibacteria group bacterium]